MGQAESAQGTHPPVKTLGAESLMAYMADSISRRRSFVTPLGEDSWKLISGFLQTSPQLSFPFADCALYLLDLINPSQKDSCMLSPMDH